MSPLNNAATIVDSNQSLSDDALPEGVEMNAILWQLDVDSIIEEQETIATREAPLNDEFDGMPPPSRRSSTTLDFEIDMSEEVPYHQATTEMSDFMLALELWVQEAGITTDMYIALLEVLQMLDHLSQIQLLPKSLSTLKRNIRTQFPLMKMRKLQLSLNPEKLPTFSVTTKTSPLADAPVAWLYWFDPIHLITTILSAESFQAKLHIGMAELVDEPSELWHSHSWATSIRSCSGEFAHYSDSTSIFPSDVIYHYCREENCACHTTTKHIGRVYAVARDYSKHATVNREITLKIQPLLCPTEIETTIISNLDVPLDARELVYLEDRFSYLSEELIVSREPSVYFNYAYCSRITTTGEGLGNYDRFFVRRVLNSAAHTVRPLNLSSPLRGELEISTFGQQHLVESFQYGNCISVTFLCFIDGFSLYRNMYRTLLGIYIIFAGLNSQEQSRRCNVFPVTLGPHGSKFEDVIGALSSLSRLDQGLQLTINGQQKFVCAYTLAFIGDMPQQQENAGFKRSTAKLGCRFCLIPQKDQGNLRYDSVWNGRYYFETMRLRSKADAQKSKAAKTRFCVEWGLSLQQSPLVRIAPALDIILSRPADPAHSEYAGMARQAHHLLIDAILTAEGRRAYITELQHFRFPPGWGRLQSPLHHLDSFRMQEHGRSSIIIPVLLRCWLQERWIQPNYLMAIWQVSTIDLDLQHASAVESIVHAFGAMAKSNSLLMSHTMTFSDSVQMQESVLHARELYQMLVEAAAVACSSSRSRSQTRSPSPAALTSTSRRGSLPDEFVDIDDIASQTEFNDISFEGRAALPSTKKSEEYQSNKRRPNVHVGVHYNLLATEYGTAYACNVLAGEMAHKLVFP